MKKILLSLFILIALINMAGCEASQAKKREGTIHFHYDTYNNPKKYVYDETVMAHLSNALYNRIPNTNEKTLKEIEDFVMFLEREYILPLFSSHEWQVYIVFCYDTHLNNKYEGYLSPNEIISKETPNGVPNEVSNRIHREVRDTEMGQLMILYDKNIAISDPLCPSAYKELEESLKGDKKKPSDISIMYNGREVNINRRLFGTLLHELIHSVEVYDSDFSYTGNHSYKKSIEAEKILLQQTGISVRYLSNKS